MTHVQCAAENADVQLGKMLDAVDAGRRGKGGHTLVVLTADHGATYGQNFYGKKAAGRGRQQLVLRACEPRRVGRRAPPAPSTRSPTPTRRRTSPR